METSLIELHRKGCLIIFFFEISRFLLQSNSARIVASAAQAFRGIPSYVKFDLRNFPLNATLT